jgi:(p)ppGpp synthase/HD superfamily hydrolase
MPDFGPELATMTLAPWIMRATALIGKRRKIGGNMFRHQFDVLGILIDHKKIDPVLLKASLIHDLLEDAPELPGATREELEGLDPDGAAVYRLVLEVTRREDDGVLEPKQRFLERIMTEGSLRARILKLADRVSNLVHVGFGASPEKVRKLLDETRAWILPHAEAADPDLHRELRDLVEKRERELAERCGPAGAP